MKKSKSKNKAIMGRRNRVHAYGPIFQYPSFDMETKAALERTMNELRGGWQYLVLPDYIKVIYPPFKAPRFL